MPRALDTDVTFPVVLDYDKDKPKESQPTFVFRSLSSREWAKANGFYERMEGCADSDALKDELCKAATVGLVGWRGMTRDGKAIEFNPEALQDIVTIQEVRELLDKSLRGNIPDPEAKKNSDLPA